MHTKKLMMMLNCSQGTKDSQLRIETIMMIGKNQRKKFLLMIMNAKIHWKPKGLILQ